MRGERGGASTMSFKTVSKTDFLYWVDHLKKDYQVFAPIPVRDQHKFREIHSVEEMELGYATTILPPKKVILPQHEDLFHFNHRQDYFETLLDDHPKVILGIHTCDMHGISLLDRLLGKDTPDPHYLRRRENTILVSLECLNPCSEYSFCKDMGTLTVPEDYDIHMTDIGEAYVLDVGSEKGSKLVSEFDAIRSGQDEDYRSVQRVMSDKWSRFRFRLQADVTELPSLLNISYKSTLWEDLGERCLGCGMCTLVCPTCYCFDLHDEIDIELNSGTRYRVWDSCQLKPFASVAGGHDFRPSHASRQRHRFMRKYRYQSIIPGLVGCVGCGRCASTCLVKISPVEILNKLYQRRVASKHGQREGMIS